MSRKCLSALARGQIEKGYPVIVIPKDYTDTILAVGYTDGCKSLRGLGFLEGDDQRNAHINFSQLNQYSNWYANDCDMILVKPASEKLPAAQACIHAIRTGIQLLLNDKQVYPNKMQGYGMIIYQNWCELLKEENSQNADRIHCISPHAFIHYENKLRTKQFFELCINLIPDIDKALMASAIRQYNEIMNFAGEIASIAQELDSLPKGELKDKRNYIINMLRRSREQEALALSYIQKAIEPIK